MADVILSAVNVHVAGIILKISKLDIADLFDEDFSMSKVMVDSRRDYVSAFQALMSLEYDGDILKFAALLIYMIRKKRNKLNFRSSCSV